ncbi:UbiA prenyltransferase family-domain-containing protein [Phlebopus sp. FC_14]|nr:UbiA prenyltransferase family-domain-containing protein [Phlebopus sp. FC_14]
MIAQYLPRNVSELGYHLYTIFLFTRADIRTALIPVALFAFVSAPLYSPIHVLHSVAWIWLHLLQFNVANQLESPEEDKINKPSRPLPSERITMQNATVLRWMLSPICLAFSALYSPQLAFVSVGMQLFTIWYNEFDGDKKWASKNILTAIMYGYMEAGGTLAAGRDYSQLGETAQLAISLTVLVFASTLHAQDFKDAAGDRLTGRLTLPILFPVASRIFIGLGIPLWSICLCLIWDVDILSSVAFIAYGCFVGARFVLYRTVEADRRSCKFYSLWFSIHHVFPGYWNYFHDGRDYQSSILLKTWTALAGTF